VLRRVLGHPAADGLGVVAVLRPDLLLLLEEGLEPEDDVRARIGPRRARLTDLDLRDVIDRLREAELGVLRHGDGLSLERRRGCCDGVRVYLRRASRTFMAASRTRRLLSLS